LFDAVCAQGLEGVVAKRRSQRYRPGERAWVKTKNKDTAATAKSLSPCDARSKAVAAARSFGTRRIECSYSLTSTLSLRDLIEWKSLDVAMTFGGLCLIAAGIALYYAGGIALSAGLPVGLIGMMAFVFGMTHG
jgi:hypothetical protein